VFVGVDWKSQEVGIAAALSGDHRLLEAYKGRDVYLALAVMANAVPDIVDTDEAWSQAKRDYAAVRQNFKSVQLGINYGKGLKSLIQDVYNNSIDEQGEATISLFQAQKFAEEIYNWHKRTFQVYWSYVANRINKARRDGFTRTGEGWIYFVNDKTRETQLLNFPSQSEAAHMLHKAVVEVYNTRELEMVCSLHDAIYIRSTESSWKYDVALLKECMARACEQTIGSRLIGGDVLGPYTHDSPYWDERGATQYKAIAKLLGPVMDHPKMKED
jgi:hypothetical protein